MKEILIFSSSLPWTHSFSSLSLYLPFSTHVSHADCECSWWQAIPHSRTEARLMHDDDNNADPNRWLEWEEGFDRTNRGWNRFLFKTNLQCLDKANVSQSCVDKWMKHLSLLSLFLWLCSLAPRISCPKDVLQSGRLLLYGTYLLLHHCMTSSRRRKIVYVCVWQLGMRLYLVWRIRGWRENEENEGERENERTSAWNKRIEWGIKRHETSFGIWKGLCDCLLARASLKPLDEENEILITHEATFHCRRRPTTTTKSKNQNRVEEGFWCQIEFSLPVYQPGNLLASLITDHNHLGWRRMVKLQPFWCSLSS